MKKTCFFIIPVIVGILLAGCALTSKKFMKSEIPEADHAFLYTEESILFLDLNKEPFMFTFFKQYTGRTLLIPPGEQTVYFKYYWPKRHNRRRDFLPKPAAIVKRITFTKSSIVVGPDIITDSETESIRLVFEPGHHYYLYHPQYPKVRDVEFLLVDETDPSSAWETKHQLKNSQKRVTGRRK